MCGRYSQTVDLKAIQEQYRFIKGLRHGQDMKQLFRRIRQGPGGDEVVV